MAPSLAFLITYHNEGEWIHRCITALMDQKTRPDEILVYDDCSEIPPDPFLSPDWNVRVIRGERNRGPSFGRNALMRSTQADYIHFHDVDDICLPEWSVRIREVIETHAPDLILTEVRSEKDGRPFSHGGFLNLNRLKKGQDLLSFAIEGAIIPSASTFRKQLAESIGGYNNEMWFSEDFHFHVRLASRTTTFQVITEPLVVKNIRAESRSEDLARVWMGVVYGILLLSEELPEQYHPNLSDKAAMAGGKLFSLEHEDAAKEAFLLATSLGRPTYSWRHPLYRFLGRSFSPQFAEQVGKVFRKLGWK